MPDENKILSFDSLKNIGDTATHFDKDSLLKLLQEIPSDIVAEYNLFIVDYLDKMILFNNIFSSIENTNLCQRFIDKLNPEQLNKVGNIATCLTANDVLKKMPQILSFLGIRVPTDEVREKTNELIDCIKNSGIDHKKTALGLLESLASLSILVELLLIHATVANSESCLFDRISVLEENNIVRLISLANDKALKYFE
jgi:hypothetical protein